MSSVLAWRSVSPGTGMPGDLPAVPDASGRHEVETQAEYDNYADFGYAEIEVAAEASGRAILVTHEFLPIGGTSEARSVFDLLSHTGTVYFYAEAPPSGTHTFTAVEGGIVLDVLWMTIRRDVETSRAEWGVGVPPALAPEPYFPPPPDPIYTLGWGAASPGGLPSAQPYSQEHAGQIVEFVDGGVSFGGLVYGSAAFGLTDGTYANVLILHTFLAAGGGVPVVSEFYANGANSIYLSADAPGIHEITAVVHYAPTANKLVVVVTAPAGQGQAGGPGMYGGAAWYQEEAAPPPSRFWMEFTNTEEIGL